MTRTAFAKSYGATSKNVRWSWSWVNVEKKFVMFGASTEHEVGQQQLIVSGSWERNKLTNRRYPGYRQAIEHLGNVTDQGFRLYTFRQVQSAPDPKTGNVKIISFEEELEERSLVRQGRDWYAVPLSDFDPLIHQTGEKRFFLEGSKRPVSSWRVERSSDARQACLDHYGFACCICEFDFEEQYGSLGSEYIHVHHLYPIAKTEGERVVDPIKHLIPVCPNCHAMIHRGGVTRKPEEIRSLLNKKPKN